jgi:Short C-terminal domain/Phospholipase_D-nuclease N-terminal
MPLAASTGYPVLDVFWTMFEIFAFVIWFWLLFVVLTDVFRSHDLSGWGKAAWTIFVLFLPLIGVLCYLIVRGRSMHERSAQQAAQQEKAFRSYVQEAAGPPPSSADQLAKLADLRQRGVITPDEFEQEKTKILASH